MRSLMRRVDMFCYKHPNFGIKNLMLYLVIANAAFYLVNLMDTTGSFAAALLFNAELVFTKGQIWRLVSFVFIPSNSRIIWLIIELYFYYFIGSNLEAAWGKGKFTIFYLTGMLMNIIYGTLFWLIGNMTVYVTASYLNLSLFLAFATLFPDTQVMLFFIIPVKVKWLAWLDAAFLIIAVITGSFPYNLLPLVAIANYLLFCGSWIFDRISPKSVRARRDQRKRTIDFKTAARKYNQQQKSQAYTRKCEVCGKTDTQYPELEFRFCSKCQGYHCFCMDHINSHVHFKE